VTQQRPSGREPSDMSVRLAVLESEVRHVKAAVDLMAPKIDAIYSDPQSSQLGRSLIERSIANSTAIIEMRNQVNEIDDWRNEMNGGYKALRLGLILLSGITAVLAIWNAIQATTPPT